MGGPLSDSRFPATHSKNSAHPVSRSSGTSNTALLKGMAKRSYWIQLDFKLVETYCPKSHFFGLVQSHGERRPLDLMSVFGRIWGWYLYEGRLARPPDGRG
jgi:hypothetical protein